VTVVVHLPVLYYNILKDMIWITKFAVKHDSNLAEEKVNLRLCNLDSLYAKYPLTSKNKSRARDVISSLC